jgi:enterochelin esterase-like enzyme
LTARLTALLALAASGGLVAQNAREGAEPPRGSLERIEVHGSSLEGNLEGDDATRNVFVYLPPSYGEERTRRYPVVYFLHGYMVGADAYVRFLGLPDSADEAIAGGAREVIVVLPDAYTVHGGSMYSSSPTIGDWEGYVARDLIAHIDARYRTIPRRESRGLSGHSMGGYGTMRIGMKHPEAFSSLYAMSACCLMIDPARGGDAVSRAAAERDEDAESAGSAPADFLARAQSAQAAAWAPNPDNPPQYFDLPFGDGELRPLIHAKWLANAPLVMVDQYVPNLERYRAIAIDVGDSDPLGADNFRLDSALTRLGIEHEFEEYEGDHMNRVGERFQDHVLPFFSREFDFGAPVGR